MMLLLAVISLPIIYLLSKIGAYLYYDPRPFVVDHFTPLVSHDPDNGFPSDHVLLLSSMSALLYPFRKKISYLLFFVTAVVAISRVYVGIHHIVDVLGSFLIAIAVVFIVHLILKRFRLDNYLWNS
jgi:undecaprenyl-diphosphatase